MMYDNMKIDELQNLLKSNEAKINNLEFELKRMDDECGKILDILNADMKSTEALHSGWTGEAAEKYINESLDQIEVFKKELVLICGQEKERIDMEKSSLNAERDAIEDAIRRFRN